MTEPHDSTPRGSSTNAAPIIAHNPAKNPSQCSEILTHLQSGKTLTPVEALDLFGCFSLSQRVTELRRRGHSIVTSMIELKSGKRVARYHLNQPKDEGSS
jgi:hypothetical protein